MNKNHQETPETFSLFLILCLSIYIGPLTNDAFCEVISPEEVRTLNKKIISLLLASLFVLTAFGALISVAGDSGQHISPRSTSLAEGGGSGRTLGGSAPFNELGQNAYYYKSVSTAATDPQAGGSGAITSAPRGLQSHQYDLIVAVKCPFVFFETLTSPDPGRIVNKHVSLFVSNPISHQWEKIGDGISDAHGYCPFYNLRENTPGTYYYRANIEWDSGSWDSGPVNKILVTYPVILVHGWLGSEADWTNMEKTLDDAGFAKNRDYFAFNYNGYDDPRNATGKLQTFIEQTKDTLYTFSKSDGSEYARDDIKFTIVCHSMGSLVTRYYMEVEGGAGNVAQWIGIGPTNHGSALANKIPDSLLSLLSSQLGRPAVLQLRTDSDTVKTLEAHHLAPGVTYRVIVGDNNNSRFGFGSDIASSNEVDQYYLGLPVEIYYTLVKGQTWASLPSCTCKPLPQWEAPRGCCYQTLRGDGAVANVQSWIDSADFRSYTGLDHIGLLGDRNVTNYVLACVENPNTVGHKVGLDNFLYPSDPDAPSKLLVHSAMATSNPRRI